MKMDHVFGIDLGTTYSCIAYMDEYGKPMVLKNSDGNHTTPSVVMVESADNIIVGEEAKRANAVEPDKVVQFIKRKMGREDDKVMLNGTLYSAPEISAYILKKLVTDANEELRQSGVLADGETVKDVVITCPAYFGANEREATMTAGKLAGLNVLSIINEPTAAAISYGAAGAGKNETVLVYDLGGGTFDITVMHIQGGDITVICTGGDDRLGGKDWDETLMEYVMGRYEEECGEDLSEDEEAVAALYGDVEKWKKSLTVREKVNITVNGAGGRLREELTREKYDEVTEELLNRTKNLLDDVLRTSEKQGYPLKKIDKILLVGGSSRMPQVAEMIARDYGITAVLQDPDEAVAKGAAIYAKDMKEYHDFIASEAERTGKTETELTEENLKSGGALERKYALMSGRGSAGTRLSVTNVLSRSYGIDALDKNDELRIFNMLLCNSKLPASVTETFYTKADGQEAVEFNIYESRSVEKSMEIGDRKPLTTIEMRFSRSVPQGTPIETTLSLDHSGVLHIQAEEKKYHTRLDTTFSLSNQMSEADLRLAAARTDSANVE